MRVIVVIFLLAFTSLSFSQIKKNKKKKKKGNKTQVINFEDQLVEGSTKRPDLFYLLQKKNFKYKRLIKLRENFLPELKATSEDLSTEKPGGDKIEQ